MSAPSVRNRLDSIDVVRGAIMILMLLDHTRDFTHAGAIFSDPLDPKTTTVLIYVTRWVTHLCAPGFVMLAGLSVGLKQVRGTPGPSLTRFLWTRGLWLVVLEVAFFRYLIWTNFDMSFLAHLQVIWVIGLSMIVLAGLIRLPPAAVAILGAVIVLGHNAFDSIRVAGFPPVVNSPAPLPGLGARLWVLLHQGGFLPVAGRGSPIVFVNYPLLPWIGIMALGSALAQVYAWPPPRRRRWLLLVSVGMAIGFVALRGVNVYGDPQKWTHQATIVRTAMSFMNVQKYPPSLLYTLATLAPSLAALALLDGRRMTSGFGGVLVTFGRVPFFFYALQWVMAHISGLVVTTLMGKSIAPYFMNLLQLITASPQPDFGGPLWSTYVCWIVGVCLLYWPCRWYANLKAQRRDWWLSYL